MWYSASWSSLCLPTISVACHFVYIFYAPLLLGGETKCLTDIFEKSWIDWFEWNGGGISANSSDTSLNN